MVALADSQTNEKKAWDTVGAPFFQGDGLPFAEVLDAEMIHRVFREEDASFGQNAIFSTDMVL